MFATHPRTASRRSCGAPPNHPRWPKGTERAEGDRRRVESGAVDPTQTGMLRDIYTRIVAGDFGATEVLALLGLLREDSPQPGALRELGNFTHRRRDKGPVHKYVRRVKAVLDDVVSGTHKGGVLRTTLVFTETEIANALDQELERHGLPRLTQVRHRQVQLVMLATLQNVALLDDKQQQFGFLALFITPQAFQLMGAFHIPARVSGNNTVLTPALSVVNDCYPEPTTGRATTSLTVAVHSGVTKLQITA